MVVETIPPTGEQLDAIGLDDVSPGDWDETTIEMVLALTSRKYQIVCEKCGFVAGGFRGKVEA